MQPFPATGAKYEIATGDIYPVWSAAGNELVTWKNSAFHIVSVATRPSFTIGNPVEVPGRVEIIGPSAQRTYDLTPDGRFIGTIAAASSQTAAPTAPTFQVVLNWFEELKAKTARAAATR